MEASHQRWWVSAAVYNCWPAAKFPSHKGRSVYSSVRSRRFFTWKYKPQPHADFLKFATKYGRYSVIYILREWGLTTPPCAVKCNPLDCPGLDHQKLRPDFIFYRVKLILLQPVNVSKRKCNAKRIMIIIWTECIWESSMRMVPLCTLLPAEFSRSSNARWFRGFEESATTPCWGMESTGATFRRLPPDFPQFSERRWVRGHIRAHSALRQCVPQSFHNRSVRVIGLGSWLIGVKTDSKNNKTKASICPKQHEKCRILLGVSSMGWNLVQHLRDVWPR